MAHKYLATFTAVNCKNSARIPGAVIESTTGAYMNLFYIGQEGDGLETGLDYGL